MPQLDRLSAGRQCNCSDNIKDQIGSLGEEGYDFVAAHVAYPWCCIKANDLPEKLPPISRPDLVLSSHEWSRLVVATVSPWIDVDSDNEHLRTLSEKALQDELSYYSYLCIPAILLELKRPRQPALAKILNDYCETPGGPVIWAVVPTTAADAASNNIPNGDVKDSAVVADGIENNNNTNCATTTTTPLINNDCSEAAGVESVAGTSASGAACIAVVDDAAEAEDDTWYWFHRLRVSCDNKQRLGLVLKLTADLPDDAMKLKRWLGEPLKAFILDTSIFLTNERRFPVLSKAHQSYIKELLTLKIQAVVTGRTMHTRPKTNKNSLSSSTTETIGEDSAAAAASKYCLYFSYLNHLYKNKPSLDIVSEWALGYEDFLQIPLQPLGDNLESQIYETFEKDPIKYVQYKNAISDAISYVKAVEVFDDESNLLIIMVLGAGRGPLVNATLEALDALSTKAKVIAVEKNPNAIVTLNFLARTKWNDRVTVVHSDMRDFKPADSDKADIVVSELLGSFGDNELSPECLDGALHLMKPNCVSIPTSYTSYLAPIHSPKLYQTVRQQALREQQIMTAFETNYVVRIHNHFLPANPKPLFTFKHPNFDLSSNDRYKELTFTASESCDLCGLVGFFYSELFTSVSLSILPYSHTPGLFSWFPIFFPFKDPIYVKKGEKIVINFWRCSNARQVWYEWCMVKPIQTPIMNCKGRSSNIRKL